MLAVAVGILSVATHEILAVNDVRAQAQQSAAQIRIRRIDATIENRNADSRPL
jgi:hypothetical protein